MEHPSYDIRDRKSDKPKWSRKAKMAVFGSFALLIVVILVISIGGAKAKYQTSNVQVNFENDATVSVSFKVKNVGNASGKPICQIDAHSPDHSYFGGDMPTVDKTLQPGEDTTTAGPVTINNNGAVNVTEADITCD